jgi:uncharacterized membrane protein
MGPGERRRSAFVAVLALVLLASAPMVSAVSYDRPQATVYTVDVDEGGDATWTIELRYQLVDEEDVGAFESIRNDFEEGNLSVFEGIEGDLSSFAEEASEATGREMSVSDFQRDVYIRDTVTQTVGVVSVDFVWSGFAEASPSEVRVGDVFVGSGLALTENERFIIENVEGLPVRNVSPQPDTSDGERLIWDGERFFEEGQPSVLFSEESSGTGDGNGSDGEGSPQGSGSSTPVALMAGFVALVSGFAGGLYLGRKKGIVGETTEEEETTEDEKRTETQKELLTDEDRVVRILKEEGGKMKQAEIVDRTDWSKSKVSMLLSNMEDEGTISKLRLGRENVIELEPDE